jgi:DNA polymerase (family 10)
LGENTYKEILNKAKSLNYEYVVFTDHNPSLSKHTENEIIDILRLRRQYIVQKNMSKKCERTKYFISLEVDIRPDGRIALPKESVNYLDLIIVSIHSSFNMEKERMTKRILKAISFPKVKILGHPTGRLLGKRQEINVDWSIVFNECKKRDIALEINAWPKRLDLPDNLVRLAIKKGIKLVIGTDAHMVSEMDNMFYGVTVARRGWAKKSDIMNTRDYADVKKWINN